MYKTSWDIYHINWCRISSINSSILTIHFQVRLLLVSRRLNQNFVVAHSTCMLSDLVRSLMSNMTNIHLGYDQYHLPIRCVCRNVVGCSSKWTKIVLKGEHFELEQNERNNFYLSIVLSK